MKPSQFLYGLASIAFLIPACEAGASAYTMLDEVVDELDAGGAIVEIGSDRGEGSTAFLSRLANSTRRRFFSIDFSTEGYSNAKAICGSCAYQVVKLTIPWHLNLVLFCVCKECLQASRANISASHSYPGTCLHIFASYSLLTCTHIRIRMHTRTLREKERERERERERGTATQMHSYAHVPTEMNRNTRILKATSTDRRAHINSDNQNAPV